MSSDSRTRSIAGVVLTPDGTRCPHATVSIYQGFCHLGTVEVPDGVYAGVGAHSVSDSDLLISAKSTHARIVPPIAAANVM